MGRPRLPCTWENRRDELGARGLENSGPSGSLHRPPCVHMASMEGWAPPRAPQWPAQLLPSHITSLLQSVLPQDPTPLPSGLLSTAGSLQYGDHGEGTLGSPAFQKLWPGQGYPLPHNLRKCSCQAAGVYRAQDPSPASAEPGGASRGGDRGKGHGVSSHCLLLGPVLTLITAAEPMGRGLCV